LFPGYIRLFFVARHVHLNRFHFKTPGQGWGPPHSTPGHALFSPTNAGSGLKSFAEIWNNMEGLLGWGLLTPLRRRPIRERRSPSHWLSEVLSSRM
jgi:hypothetical protein